MTRKPQRYIRDAQEHSLDVYNTHIAPQLGRQTVEAMELLVEACVYAHQQTTDVLGKSEVDRQGVLTYTPYPAKEIYDSLRTCIIRMVVLLFAEERALLPVEESAYAQRYSLVHLAESLEKKHPTERATSHRGCSSLFSIWNGMYHGIQDEDVSLFAHKGILFHSDQTPIFAHNTPKISDRYLHEIFKKLRFVHGEKVRYQDVYVEQVGSLYELLMELHIEWEGEGIILKGANLRKDTGAHYTPRYLCDFIVEESLSRRLSPTATSDEILALRICDPAMGSGAFLMAACRYLGMRLLRCWKQENHALSEHEEALSLARVSVVQHCLYGVDVNQDAVLLSRLSLWLESGARRQDFEFVHDSIVHGNGVVGFRTARDIETVLGFSNANTSMLIKELSAQEPAVLNDVFDVFLAANQRIVVKNLGKRAAKELYALVQKDILKLLMSRRKWSISALPSHHRELYHQLQTRPFHWRIGFADVFTNHGGFDAVLGNPPFINCIRGNISAFQKKFLKMRYSYVSGSADLSYYFLELAAELIHDDGVIGIILPRVSMGAGALREFRIAESLPKPSVMYSANHYQFFAHANIKVVVYIFDNAPNIWVSNSDMPMDAQWVETRLDYGSWWHSFQGNWWASFWLALQKKSIPLTQGFSSITALGFEVRGGLTTGDFYNIQVEERPYGDGLRLLTSGGIDPNVSYWGDEHQKQRFNKKRYRYPRILNQDYDQGLQKKLIRSARPKLIIANLTKEMEVFLDDKGLYQAATGTQTVYHRDDDVFKLQQLQEILHSRYGNLLFHAMLAYNAMHSNISVEKRFLENFPVPTADFSSDVHTRHS